MCRHQRESEVFQRVHDAIDHHSSLLVQDLKRDAEDSCDFLNKFASKWNLHCERLQLIRKIFMFLDRTFVIQNRSIKSLWDLGLQTFARYFEQEKDVIEVKVISDFLECLENDRKGDPVDSDLLKVFTVMFKQLNIADHLEKPILDSTRVFYHSEALSLFQNSSSISNYLKRVCDRISEEENRSNSYISPSTLPFIVNLIHGEMIRNHIAELTGANLLELFASNSVEDLKRLYSLLNSVESLDSLKVALANSVLIEGRSIVQDTANDKILIKRLLDIQSKYSIILSEAFLSKAEFNNATKENFRKFINERANKPAELLAKYIDELLRSGDKTSSDAGLEATFTSLMMLFKHIDDKDVFEAFYKKDLAKRLLLNKSASSEAELSMISMLRQECGQNFTHKLEGMFTDISVSEELNARFQLFLKSGSLTSQIDTSLEFEPQVLTISHWPTVKESSLFAPPEVKAYQMLFEKFYHSLDKNSGRKLQWDYAMSFAVLSGDFPKGRKELVVSAYQAAILLQFNSSKTISFSDLLKSTMMEKNELERNLDSLLSTPRILQKKPKEKDFKETDMLRVNPDFESRLYRVKVNAVQIEETVIRIILYSF
jgi:cullin-4